METCDRCNGIGGDVRVLGCGCCYEWDDCPRCDGTGILEWGAVADGQATIAGDSVDTWDAVGDAFVTAEQARELAYFKAIW